MNAVHINGIGSAKEGNPTAGDSILVLSTPDLLTLSDMWAREYSRLYPEFKIKVISFADLRVADKLLAEGNIGFVSGDYFAGSQNQSLWRVVVGRDIVIPVINAKNTLSDEIMRKGISPESFGQFFNSEVTPDWGTLLKNGQNSPVKYYWINDETILSALTGFLKTDQIKSGGIEVANGREMISAIQKDLNGIGFCKMTDILDFKNQCLVENIRLLPIDRDGNGLIDYNENIYGDFNVFSRGVWIGKYPKSLYSNIYSVSSVQPDNENEIAFLKWVITDGQQFLYANGYSDLLITERQSTTDRLYNAKIYAGATSGEKSLLKAILLIIATIILIGLIVEGLARYRKRKKAVVQINGNISKPVLDENSLIIPAGIYFDKTHTWAFMEQNGVVKIGIDDFMQHITGSITRIKMKNRGDMVKKGDQILSIIQNGKQLNLYAPVSGMIMENNKMLDTNSSVINTSPYTDGWIYKIEPTNWFRETQLLFMADKYRQYIKNEFSRLKDFLAVTLTADNEKYSQLILQDGGELKDGILSNLGPEVWEDFQTKFIDPSRQVWFYEIC